MINDEKNRSNNKNTLELLYEAQRNANEAQGSGQIILEKLENQDEHLRTIEDTLESNEYTLLKSMRILRGMTWSGTIYNMFTKDPEVTDLCMNHQLENTNDKKTFSNNNNTNDMLQRNELFTSSSSSSSSLTSNSNSNSLNQEDKVLNDISKTVATLKDMSLIMGEHIENNQHTLERIDQKATRTNDHTHAATLKASQITARSKHTKGNYIGRYQFIEIHSNHYVGVVGEDILLIEKADRSTYYELYMKEANLLAAQNCKTLKYLGSTIWGPIRASGNVFGRQEELSLNLNGSVTGMFFLGKNLGGGGWLKYEKGNPLLSLVTTGITDKKDILMVRAVKCTVDVSDIDIDS